jgi:hypothetical protein
MKKIILVLFAGFMTFAVGRPQNQPMAVGGPVCVKGSLLSEGPVHVLADTISLNGIIDNQENGKLKFNEGVILYSNNKRDGLLINRNTTMSDISIKEVAVRRTFVITGTPETTGYYYALSFPFTVGLLSHYYGGYGGTEIRPNTHGTKIRKRDGSEAKLWDDYDVACYNGHSRAFVTRSASDARNWSWFDEEKFGVNEVAYLTAGTGYRIWSRATSAPDTLDFVVTNQDSIAKLLKYEDKSTAKLYYETEAGTYNPYYPDNSPSEGWNFIGGLNTASFAFKAANVGYYDGNSEEPNDLPMIYYFDRTGVASGIWKNEYPADGLNTVLSPYATFYVQTGYKDNIFTFKKEGLVPLGASPAGFRAAEIPTKDMLRLTLASKNNPSLSDKTYIELKPDYDEWFKGGEDGVKMFNDNNDSASPQVYSWFKKDFEDASTRTSTAVSYELALNRIPAQDKEIPLGVMAPAGGQYTFSLDALQHRSVSSAYLKDKQENQYVDLLQDTYTCWLNKEKNDDRFVLFVQTGTVPVEEVLLSGTDVFAYAQDNRLIVKNIQKGDQVKIMDLSGRLVVSGIASGNEFSASVIQKGVYLVNVRGEKTVVLKVINK